MFVSGFFVNPTIVRYSISKCIQIDPQHWAYVSSSFCTNQNIENSDE